MTVGSNVKNCFASLKSIEATLLMLIEKTNSNEAKHVFLETKEIVTEVKDDLNKQVIFLAKEEPKYK